MPPSHAASRAVLLVLVISIAAVSVLLNLDPTTWAGFNEQAQALWAGLRSAVEGAGDSTALGRG